MGFRRKSSKPAASVSGTVSSENRQPSLHRVRLPVDLLKPGMRVVKLDRPWTEVPVLFQGFTLADDAQARILRQHCEWVLVEDEEAALHAVLDEVADRKARTTRPLSETQPLAEELPRARQAWSRTQNFVEKVTRDIEAGNDLNLDDARPVLQQCVASIKANAGAMFWVSRIKHREAYTAEHCLRVAIFSIAFARFLGMPDGDLETIGVCGLLHDLGKLRVPDHILNKPGALSPDEFRIMREHTSHGYELLKADQGLDPIVADVTLHHHERMDGRGYPQQLAEWQISRFARLISIVDAFDAITSDRCYRDGLPTSEAIRILYRNRGQQFDAGMVEAFIRMIGIYPAGSLVELNTGEVALVVATHPGRKLSPRVEILLDARKQPVTPRILDLSETSSEDGHQREIAGGLPDGAYGMSLEDRIRQLTKDNAYNV
ncbi:metal dependent phosphohydrolase [Marinobacter santoriniensis NKSG1]|uniref:Metal dependent phosphohydrolase n=1 Tax=Marinobacter santoriniensis NKSG1 TaxID=1288826 RepID=M7CMB0_9GAMM|nr:HD-GYP domain-containing protein [Marinobacter santoriniensis]EMP54781.1 metal dependent phosphohydrolase [Marinobacter santoriniensis NKSG1]